MKEIEVVFLSFDNHFIHSVLHVDKRNSNIFSGKYRVNMHNMPDIDMLLKKKQNDFLLIKLNGLSLCN